MQYLLTTECYNGPAYAQNLYDVKMARAYKNFKELLGENGS